MLHCCLLVQVAGVLGEEQLIWKAWSALDSARLSGASDSKRARFESLEADKALLSGLASSVRLKAGKVWESSLLKPSSTSRTKPASHSGGRTSPRARLALRRSLMVRSYVRQSRPKLVSEVCTMPSPCLATVFYLGSSDDCDPRYN